MSGLWSVNLLSNEYMMMMIATAGFELKVRPDPKKLTLGNCWSRAFYTPDAFPFLSPNQQC